MPGYDDDPLPSLGDMFAAGVMRPTPGPPADATGIIQPFFPSGFMPPKAPSLADTIAATVRAYRGSSTPYETLSHTRADDRHGRQNALGWGRGKFYFSEHEPTARAYSIMRGANPPIVNEADLTINKAMTGDEYDRRYRDMSGRRSLYEPYGAGYDMMDRDMYLEQLDRQIRGEGYDAIRDDVGQIAIFDPAQARFRKR